MTSDIIIKRYVFTPVKSNMYIIMTEEEALIIDPHISEVALQELKNERIKYVTILLTHEHYDHTTGVNWLKDNFESRLICHKKCAEAISKERNNRPVVIAAILMQNKKTMPSIVLDGLPQNYICRADDVFEDEMQIDWCNHSVKIVSTPGHTQASCCIELDNKYIFTGDSLIKDTAVITRFPTGSRERYDAVTLPYLKSIPKDYKVMPGHGEAFFMKEIEFEGSVTM